MAAGNVGGGAIPFLSCPIAVAAAVLLLFSSLSYCGRYHPDAFRRGLSVPLMVKFGWRRAGDA